MERASVGGCLCRDRIIWNPSTKKYFHLEYEKVELKKKIFSHKILSVFYAFFIGTFIHSMVLSKLYKVSLLINSNSFRRTIIENYLQALIICNCETIYVIIILIMLLVTEIVIRHLYFGTNTHKMRAKCERR